VTAQLCLSPSASSCAPEMPGTGTMPVPGAPSCCERFDPQQTTSPVPARMAQTWFSPTATELAAPTPETVTGVPENGAESTPSWPELFEPQHWTVPSTTAQLVSPPAASALAGQHPCEAHWKKPGLQVNPHSLASHLLVECCGVAQ